MGDSLISYNFSILDTDSLGAISGRVVVDLPDKSNLPIKLFFNKTGSKDSFKLNIDSEEFKIDVPAGKYLLSGFIDSDLNGEKGNGTIFPFRLAETMAFYPDTISVRARFETSEILFEFK